MFFLFALLMVFIITPTPTPAVTPTPEFPAPGSYTAHDEYDGLTRTYRIYIPKTYTGEAVPLVIVMHGAGGSAQGTENFTQFDVLADEKGFIVVYPDSTRTGWSDGRPQSTADDIGFISQLIDDMTGMVSIDTTRVYAAGFSAGGMMALRLGCNIPNKIAAVVSVASTQPTYQLNECNISQPMPVMFVIGTLDPIIQWNGMDFYLSAQDSVGYWIAHNDCEGTTEVVEEFDEDKDTLERVRRETYGGCADDTEVTIYGSIGGGHTWPGHPIEAPFDLGKTLMDIDANEVIWDFFTRYAVSDEKDAATPEATPTEG